MTVFADVLPRSAFDTTIDILSHRQFLSCILNTYTTTILALIDLETLS
jgi:hypothetical protein